MHTFAFFSTPCSNNSTSSAPKFGCLVFGSITHQTRHIFHPNIVTFIVLTRHPAAASLHDAVVGAQGCSILYKMHVHRVTHINANCWVFSFEFWDVLGLQWE